MEVLELAATQFIKPMSTGRNRPLLLGCVLADYLREARQHREALVNFVKHLLR